MRPLIAAEPMFRAPSPEMVAESTLACAPALFATAETGKATSSAQQAVALSPRTARRGLLIVVVSTRRFDFRFYLGLELRLLSLRQLVRRVQRIALRRRRGGRARLHELAV